MASAHIAEIPAWHTKRHALLVAGRSLKITSKVVHHLGHQARPVDRIDRTDFVPLFERKVVRDCFDQVLAIIKHTPNGEVVDVVIEQAEHLRLLKRTHASIRTGHEYAHPFFSAHRILSRTSGIAAGGAENIELLATSGQFIFKQIAQQLHGHVFERQRRTVGQGLQIEALFKTLERHYRIATKYFGGIGFATQGA